MWPDKDLNFVRVDDDEQGLHYGLFNEEQLISVISLFNDGESVQFRKFATLISEQGKGFGARLLEFVLNEAEKTGAKRIWCNARSNKIDYYKKFGLTETKSTFTKEGLNYIIMEKNIL